MSTLASNPFGYAPQRRYRAASLRQVLAQLLRGWAHGLWAGLEQLGRQRARAELQRAAALYQSSRPELAAQLRRLAQEPLR